MTNEESKYEKDCRLVKRLLDGDQAAWNDLCVNTIAPMVRSRKYMQMLFKYSVPMDSVVTQVWLELTEDYCRRLRNYRFEVSLEAWLWRYVNTAVRTVIRQHTDESVYLKSEPEPLPPIDDRFWEKLKKGVV